jgi:Abnormal spindle-like microcephaly-assoc'd, ASPM-SPD-2-Hydin
VLVLRSNHISLRSLALLASVLLFSLLEVGCAGNGPKQLAEMSVSSDSFNFQTVVVGEKATQSIKISNAGSAALQISAFTLSNKEFSITGPAFPQTIAPASTLSYTLTFAPTAAGSVTGTLNFTTNASPNLTSVSLAGSGEKAFANLIITPTVVSFGNLALKSTGTQNVTLQNTGDINLSVQGVTLSGAGFGFSDLSPGFSLAPNQKITFQVWFSPKAAGPSSATLTLLSPNIASPETVAMSGDGVAATTTAPPSTPPTAPPPVTQHTVALSWKASTSQVIGYHVYRSETSGGSYSLLNGTTVNALTYSDATVSSGTTYYYVVTAVDSTGTESVDSNQVTAVIPSS